MPLTPQKLRDLQLEARRTASLRDWWFERLARARTELAAAEAGYAVAEDAARRAAAELNEATSPET